MVKHAGKASEEYAVMAQDLNQSFLGLSFAYHGDGVMLEKLVTVIEELLPVAA